MTKLEDIQLNGMIDVSFNVTCIQENLKKNLQVIIQNVKAQKHRLDLLNNQNKQLAQTLKTNNQQLLFLKQEIKNLLPLLTQTKDMNQSFQKINDSMEVNLTRMTKFQQSANLGREMITKKINSMTQNFEIMNTEIQNKFSIVTQFQSKIHQLEIKQDQNNLAKLIMQPQNANQQPNQQDNKSDIAQQKVKPVLIKGGDQIFKAKVLQKLSKLQLQIFNCIRKDQLDPRLKPIQARVNNAMRLIQQKLDLVHYDNIISYVQSPQKGQIQVRDKVQKVKDIKDEAQDKQKKSNQKQKEIPPKPLLSSSRQKTSRPLLPSSKQLKQQYSLKNLVLQHGIQIDSIKQQLNQIDEQSTQTGIKNKQKQFQRQQQQKFMNEKIDNIDQKIKNQNANMNKLLQSLTNQIKQINKELREGVVYHQKEEKVERARFPSVKQKLIQKQKVNQKQKADLRFNQLKHQLIISMKQFQNKINQKQSKDQISKKITQVCSRIQEVKIVLTKKADFQSIKKNMSFFQNKLNQVIQLIIQRESEIEATAAKRGWSCLSCQKKLQKFQQNPRGGQHKIWNNLPYKYESPKIGGKSYQSGFGKTSQTTKNYRTFYLQQKQKRRKQQNGLPIISMNKNQYEGQEYSPER